MANMQDKQIFSGFKEWPNQQFYRIRQAIFETFLNVIKSHKKDQKQQFVSPLPACLWLPASSPFVPTEYVNL